MACLRQSYEEYVENEPEEMESDRPTDEEMAIYDQEERRHEKMVSRETRPHGAYFNARSFVSIIVE